MSNRVSVDSYFLQIATVVALRGTCSRLKVGCVLVNHRNHIIGTGYNGKASSLSHCIEEPCPGAHLKTGMGTGTCEAIHAEANALLQCKDVYAIHTIYVTHSPCRDCIKLLLNTSCKIIVYEKMSPGIHMEALVLWRAAGRELIPYEYPLGIDQNQ